jgi:ZIP family zinc transporter
MSITIGLLIPLLGTMLGSAFVFFMRDEMSARLQKTLLGFASGVRVPSSPCPCGRQAIPKGSHSSSVL